MKKHVLALLAVAATGSVMAQAQPAATIINAQGMSTVSVGNKLVNATSGMKLAQGAQLLTTATSSMTVDFAGACTATIKSGQSLNVNLADCKSFVAQQVAVKKNLSSMGSGSAAGGVEGFAAATGLSTSAAIGAAVVAAAVTGVAINDATGAARYQSVANGDGTFTVTDTKTKKTAIVSAGGKVISAS